ncbi:hypothetical protein FOA43_002557 [Brettanomyces nanus]|uniref:Uncharacterized protein n=1 Tax=Eeniella nana TaxID=13502 RepID=A0A875RV40_EENNA|nr:uncharacterized protein FOA43_002557 [Brettanomyces nanus]QPG75207.1 hypothetical protein FOA43_002557 [Brettanomyces nanus]
MEQINVAQAECKQLTLRLSKAKQQSRDATLQLLASNCRQRLDGTGLNFSEYRTLKGHFDKVADVAWVPDNRHVVSASQDGFLLVWDSITGFKSQLIELDDPWVMCCDVSRDSRLVATGGLENACIVYKLGLDQGDAQSQSEKSILAIFKGHREYISGLSFLSGSSSQIVTCSGDKSSILWDTTKGGQVGTYYGHLGDVLSLSVNKQDPNGFVTCSCDRMALVWDARIPTSVRKFSVSNVCDASAVQFFPDGHSFACGSDDGTIKMFDMRSDGEIAEYGTSEIRKYKLKASRMYPTAASTTSGLMGSAQASMEASIDNPGVVSIDFSRSGRLLFTSYGELNSVIVRDTITGEIIGSLEGHRECINRIKVSDDGLGIATASRDHTVKIWSC